jgi:hypothetical protein
MHAVAGRVLAADRSAQNAQTAGRIVAKLKVILLWLMPIMVLSGQYLTAKSR